MVSGNPRFVRHLSGNRKYKQGPAETHEPLYIGVWSENFGAQRLYARYGFQPVGEYLFPVGQHRDREFILKRQPVYQQ